MVIKLNLAKVGDITQPSATAKTAATAALAETTADSLYAMDTIKAAQQATYEAVIKTLNQ